MAKQQINWITLDESILDTHCTNLYNELKEARKIAAQAREKFEAAFSHLIDNAGGLIAGYNQKRDAKGHVLEEPIIVMREAGEQWVFGYNFGRLSAGLIQAKEPRKGSATVKATLAKPAAPTPRRPGRR